VNGIYDHIYRTWWRTLGGLAMSALSQSLHQSILRALSIAREYHQREATPEHLLFALTEDPEATPVLLARNVDVAKLRDDLSTSLSRASANVQSSIEKSKPNTAFQSIIQRAVRHVLSVDQNTVTGAHVLVSLFADPVAQFLRDQSMTRYDAVNYVCHGVVKHPERAASVESGGISLADAEPKTNGPDYEVVLLNDEYTTMAFVVCVLQEVFRVTHDEAMRIMFSVDKNGTGSCGYYSRAEAQNLAARVVDLARQGQHPLRCIVRPDERPHGVVRIVARAVIMVVPRNYLPSWFERLSGW
jgi:ATP-dependent Clp protease adapter protein ClpS